MPRWMKWIDSVQILENDPKLSRCKSASSSFEFAWLSRILKLVCHQIIQWESVDGFSNRGTIRFYGHHEKSIVRLTLAYNIPSLLAQLMNNFFLEKIVESTIRADLERFKEYRIKFRKGLE